MRIIISLIIFFALSFNINAKDIEAYFNSKQFKIEGKGTLIENYLFINPMSIKFAKNAEGKLQGQIEITQIYKQGENIVDFKKYVLKTNEIGADSIAHEILDQQRFMLSPGDYTYELDLKDLNDENPSPFRYQELVSVQEFNNKYDFSDVEFIDSYTKTEEVSEFSKSGYLIIPYVLNHLPSDIEKLAYYSELYVDAVDESFVLTQFIEDFETSRQLNKYSKLSKVKSEHVTPIFNVFNISELPSGKYNLVLQLKNKENVIIAEKKTFFTRENPTNFDLNNFLADNISNTFVDSFSDSLLNEYIPCLMPISTTLERSVILRLDSLSTDMKKRFFYSFWAQRDEARPQDKWAIYHGEVIKVEKQYSNQIKHGYETDRGRVYLQYGPPNAIMERPNETNSYPYEIWHYYRSGKYSNKKFIFYNTDLISNDYQLLHSDMYGERYNYRWQIDLHKRNTPFESVDDTNPANNTYGNPQKDLFYNPR